MKPESRQALFHGAVASCFCMATVYTGVFDGIFVQVGYEHHAEARVASLPAFLAMPFNSLTWPTSSWGCTGYREMPGPQGAPWRRRGLVT